MNAIRKEISQGLERKTYKITIAGQVQGVGYRNYCLMVAKKINLQGNVRNLPNGNVVVKANLNLKEKEYFLNQLRIGMPYSKVGSILHTEVSPEHFIGFRILL